MPVHEFRVGAFRCAVVSDHPEGAWPWPWESYFRPATGVAEGELERALAEEGEVRPHPLIGYNCVAVDTGEHRIVIDTGLGLDYTEYGQKGAILGRLVEGLEEAGFAPPEIDTVVLTHLHTDHTRGAMWSGRRTFPHARHVVAELEARFWERETENRPGQDGVFRSSHQLLEVAGPTLKRIGLEDEIAPGVTAVPAAGHTPGHMAVLIESEGERLLCLGDTFYDRVQLRRPDWWTPMDLDGPRSVASRKRLVAMAADEGIPVVLYHLPFPGLGRIRRSGTVHAWVDGL
ncbi:MAG TPA: MBL fold metallo-hydrolase [Candidatus Dormibacteraeota bacterium]|nr:MBL fold metallo-hydrolase [Candidatus Dormibacteraeota bacterium]